MKLILRGILFHFVLALCCGSSFAAKLTEAQALNRALNDLPYKADPQTFRISNNAGYTVAYESENLYAFNFGKDGGFIITPSDDEINPSIIGYADSGRIDLDNAPSGFKWWLSMAEQCLSDKLSSGNTSGNLPMFYEPVSPLLKTKWNQEDPFNAQCPVFNGRRCCTGCVATAMAQIMKYHQYPEYGKGSYSYVTRTNAISLSYDFSNAVFQWPLMPDDPIAFGCTASQREAISTLMFACGMGTSMDYGPDSSGAYSETVAGALNMYFGYSSEMEYVSKATYSDEDWEYVVYKELSEGRPVYYDGDGEGSHAFVCDGYFGGAFHFNWGWGGSHDGYFMMIHLNPGNYDYTQNQHATIGIRPADNGDNSLYEQLYTTGDFTYEDGRFCFWKVYGYSMHDFSSQMGINILSEGETELDEGSYLAAGDGLSYSNCDMARGITYGYSYIKRTVNINLPDGKYRIFPAYKVSNKWRRLRCPMDKKRYVTLVVKDGAYCYNSDLSGVADAVHGNVEVSVEAGEIVIRGADSEAVAYIYSASGALQYAGTERRIAMGGGIYFVRIGNVTAKVII